MVRSEQLGKKFVLCVDLDNVTANYEAGFARVVAGEKGVPVESIGPQTTWDFSTCPNWPIHSYEEFADLHAIGVTKWSMLLTLPPVEGASDTLWRLNDEHDVHIRVVTHRYVRHGYNAVTTIDTIRWLELPRDDGRPLVPFRDICFVGDKENVGGDLYVDDSPRNIEAIREAGIDALVMSTGYNQHVEGPRADNWDDVYNYVVAKINNT